MAVDSRLSKSREEMIEPVPKKDCVRCPAPNCGPLALHGTAAVRFCSDPARTEPSVFASIDDGVDARGCDCDLVRQVSLERRRTVCASVAGAVEAYLRQF